jgi:subtilase family serine protease
MQPKLFLFLLATSCYVGLSSPIDSIRTVVFTTDTDNTKEATLASRPHTTNLASRSDLAEQSSVPHDHIHNVVFVVQQKNMQELTRQLHDISDPASLNYGKHLSKDQVTRLTRNAESLDVIVSYLQSNGASAVSQSSSGDFINAKAPIAVWERMFDTKFYSFNANRGGRTDRAFVRAGSYSIPEELNSHVQGVLNIIDTPVFGRGSDFTSHTVQDAKGTSGRVPSDHAIPPHIASYYNMSNKQGDIDQDAATDDLGANGFNEWLYNVADMTNPPLVMSLSYGAEERHVPQATQDAFLTQAIKLSAMGVTIVAASGDDGANSPTSACGYQPLYLPSSPYVTAVGSTSVSETASISLLVASSPVLFVISCIAAVEFQSYPILSNPTVFTCLHTRVQRSTA